MSALLIVVAVTLVVSALCSLFEATLYSTRVATLEAARDQEQHTAGAQHFLRLKRQIAVPTSAILILNTIANTTGATVAGMLAARSLGIGYVPVFSAGLTLAILLFSEILPKTYGATKWRALWPTVVWPLVLLEKILAPLIWLTQHFAGWFVGKETTAATTEDEIVAMIRMGASAGELSPTELELLTAVFRFDEARAEHAMFPRGEAVWLDASWDLEQCLEVINRTQHTRYPLCVGSLDELVGMVHVKDLLARVREQELNLRALARPLRRVPATMPVRSLFRQMQRAQPHMVAVVDERGTVVGFATLENLMEQLVGAVQDEFDREEPDIVAEGPETFLVQGGISLTRLNVELSLSLPDVEANTISGLIVAQLGRLPRRGDQVDLGKIRAEVVSIEGDRAASVRVVRQTHQLE